ncbi:MAG: hypothetical protein ABIA59_07280 [Candidatus Latescibacterota bacterium]
MKLFRFCGLITALMLFSASVAVSGPILKPRKYYGPIPRSALSLRVGFHGGANNEQMWGFIDGLYQRPAGDENTDDFGNAIILDATYTYKLHPQFAFRLDGSLSILRSASKGYFVPATEDTIQPIYDFSRRFNVDLFVIETSGVYYFTDASVNGFQPYIGAGFSAGFPRATYKEGFTDRDSGTIIRDNSNTEWSLEAGVHALLGALYYISNSFAFTAETRFQILQSKFPIEIDTEEGRKTVKFDVDYEGFVISVGGAWAF